MCLVNWGMGFSTLHLHSGDEQEKGRCSSPAFSPLSPSVVRSCSWSTYPLSKARWSKSQWCSAKFRAMWWKRTLITSPMSNCLLNSTLNMHMHMYLHVQIRLAMTILRGSGLFSLKSCDALVFLILDFSELWISPALCSQVASGPACTVDCALFHHWYQNLVLPRARQ